MMRKKEAFFRQYLTDHGLDIFTLEDLDKAFPQGEYKIPLRNMVNSNELNTIEKGKYCQANFRDEFVIGNVLASDGIVAYWSSLHHHGLTEQIPVTVFIQTTKQKRNKRVFGIPYKFIKVRPYKIAGIIHEGYGNHQFRITDKEKTIVDCFDLSEYGGGFQESVNAFLNHVFDPTKMLQYSIDVRNRSVLKRLGFLAEVAEKKDFSNFIASAQRMTIKKYVLLDPSGPDQGKYLARWHLRINRSVDELLAEVNRNIE